MSDERQNELPGIPPGQLPGTSTKGISLEFLGMAPPLDWGEPMPAVEKQGAPGWAKPAVAAGDGEVSNKVKERTATPSASNSNPTTEQSVKARAVKAQKSTRAKPATEQAEKRKSRLDKVISAPPKAKAARPSRTRAATKSAELKGPGGPAEATNASGSDIVPPITDEAVSFLSKNDPSPQDLLKLSPDSMAFVKYHFNFVERVEASSQARNAYLMANAKPITPAFQKFADALSKQSLFKSLGPIGLAQASDGRGVQHNSQHLKAGAYAPKHSPNSAQERVAIHFGTKKLRAQEATRLEEADIGRHDIQRLNKVFGTTQLMSSAQIDEVTPTQAGELVAGDLKDLMAISNNDLRTLAVNAMFESGKVQPRYRAELDKQAPELVASDRATVSPLAKDRARGNENSIEPTRVRSLSVGERSEQDQLSGAILEAQEEPVPRPHRRDRIFLGLMKAAQATGRAFSFGGKKEGVPATSNKVGAPRSGGNPTVAEPKPAETIDKSTVVPEAVSRRFLKVDHDYFFPDRTPAFSDRGNRLATRGTHPEVVRSLIEIAKARGWDEITVKGEESFRRSSWMEAALNGLKVAGYQPTALDLAELANRPARNSVERGRLQQRDMSPRKEGPQIARSTLTGQHSQPAAVQSPTTASSVDPALTEKAKAFDKRKAATVLKKYPELASGYGIVEAARTFASERLPESAREEFVGMARRHVLQKIMSGEAVKGPKVYLADARARVSSQQSQGATAEKGDSGKGARAKVAEREQ